MSNESIDRMIQRMDDIRDREEAELRRLTADPSVFCIAQLLTDRLEKCLTYLCNYESMLNHNGGRTPILDVIAELEREVRDEFRRITGKEYVPTICRQIRFRDSDPNRTERTT
jgi:hypothetical protein